MREEGGSEDFKDNFLRMEAEVGFKMGGRSQFSGVAYATPSILYILYPGTVCQIPEFHFIPIIFNPPLC
jgi:hypothetical protein